jgi:hypothetical protein
MRKTFCRVSLIAVGVLLCAACGDTFYDAQSNYPDDNVVRVTTQVAPTAAVVRAASDGLDPLASDNYFGLYLLPIKGNEAFRYTNVLFRYAADAWIPADGSELHWQSKSTNYQYSAYALAYKTDVDPVTDISRQSYYDITDESTLSYDLAADNIDLLWASGLGTAEELTNNADRAVNLVFAHKFAQFRVEVEIGNVLYKNDYDVLPLTKVTFTNAGGAGTFDVLTGILSSSDVVSTIEAPMNVNTGYLVNGSEVNDGKFLTEAACMVPGEQSIKVSLTINGDVYTYTQAAAEYQAGCSYTLKVKVGASSVNGTGITAGNWINDTESLGTGSALTTY